MKRRVREAVAGQHGRAAVEQLADELGAAFVRSLEEEIVEAGAIELALGLRLGPGVSSRRQRVGVTAVILGQRAAAAGEGGGDQKGGASTPGSFPVSGPDSSSLTIPTAAAIVQRRNSERRPAFKRLCNGEIWRPEIISRCPMQHDGNIVR